MGGMTFVLIFSLPIRNPILTWERRLVRNTANFVSWTIDFSEKIIDAIQTVLEFMARLIPGV